MKQSLLRYWLAMNASALQAGAHAGRAFFALAGAHAIANEIPPINWPQLAAVFLLAFAMEILNYLDTHPLPLLPSADGFPKPAADGFPLETDALSRKAGGMRSAESSKPQP